MLNTTLIRPQSAFREIKIEITEILSRRGTACLKGFDPDNDETLYIFFDPSLDDCIHVQVGRNIRANDAKRKMKEILFKGKKDVT